MPRQRAEWRKAEDTQGQDAIFRGTSGGDAKLRVENFKDQRSVRGKPSLSIASSSALCSPASTQRRMSRTYACV